MHRRRANRALRLLSVSATATWLLAAAGCHEEKPKARAAALEGPRVAVSTAAVVRTEGGETAVPAVVRARQRAVLSSRAVASVIAVPHREGDRVTAGAVLVRLDDRALRSALTAAEAAMEAAEADRRRVGSLVVKGAATPRENDAAVARAAAARAGWEGARDQLAYVVLRAPFAGWIGRKLVDVGDVVSPGVTLVELEGEDGFELEATLDADLAASFRPGFEARAIVHGRDSPLPAVLRAVSPAGDPVTHRFEVRADLPSAAGLRSGLFARLVLPSSASSPRLTFPAEALFQRGGLAGVFVVVEGRARLRWIAAGATAGGRTEVRAGLEPGERVVLDPAGLTDGASVIDRSSARSGVPERLEGTGGAPPHPPAR